MEIVEVLIASDALVNEGDCTVMAQCCCVYMTSCLGRLGLDIVEVLIASGAVLNQVDNLTSTNLHTASGWRL